MKRGHEVPGIEPGAAAVQSPLHPLPTSLGVSLWLGMAQVMGITQPSGHAAIPYAVRFLGRV